MSLSQTPWPAESPSSASLAAREALVDAQLLTCRALVQAVGSAVTALSEAGQGLQSGVSNVVVDGIELRTRLVTEDATVARAGHGLVSACNVLGVALISLAAVLSGEVLSPLEDMHRSIQAERKQKKEDYAKFREQEIICSKTLTDSFLKKDKALADLQRALREQRDSPTKQKSKKTLFGAKPDIAATSVESKVQKAASSQTIAIEELAQRTDEAMLARMRADDGANALNDTLARVDKTRRSLLHASIEKCATAFVETAHAVQQEAHKLNAAASELQQSITSDSLNGNIAKPSWSDMSGLGMSRFRMEDTLEVVGESESCPSRKLSGQSESSVQRGRRHSEDLDSPFVAPTLSASLGKRNNSSSSPTNGSLFVPSAARQCIIGATGLQELRASAVSGNPFRDSDLENDDDDETQSMSKDTGGRALPCHQQERNKRRPPELAHMQTSCEAAFQ